MPCAFPIFTDIFSLLGTSIDGHVGARYVSKRLGTTLSWYGIAEKESKGEYLDSVYTYSKLIVNMYVITPQFPERRFIGNDTGNLVWKVSKFACYANNQLLVIVPCSWHDFFPISCFGWSVNPIDVVWSVVLVLSDVAIEQTAWPDRRTTFCTLVEDGHLYWLQKNL